MLRAMWLYGGLRAAPGSARGSGRGGFSVPAFGVLIAALLCASAYAQDAAPVPDSAPPAQHDAPPAPDPDVVRAPPPEPPDDSNVPVVRDKPKPSASKPSKPAQKKPEASKPAAPSSPPKSEPVLAQPEPKPAVEARPETPVPAPAPPPAAAPSAPVEPAGSPEDADFSGRADGSAPAPQDDFAADAQVVRRGFKRAYSVRIDTLNWLLLGRLSVELEMSVFKYLSVTLTPVFVTHTAPIAINYAGLDDPLKQHSNGLGPISGVSIGVGAWFWGEPFKGYVLRLELTNYGYNYRTKDGAGTIDSVDFTERRLSLFIGSHSRFGPFTFAGGFGLGYELHQAERCGLSASGGGVSSRDNDCKGKQLIALDREVSDRADVNGPLHPVYFQARFSLGVVF